MTNPVKSTFRAFSLIELSIVILIISIIATGALTVSRTSVKSTNLKTTQDRMATVYKALLNFLVINKRLPCPASITEVMTSSSFGTEGSTPGTCNGSTVLTGDIVYGMVPVNALGLANEMAIDGFGTKIAYILDRRFTVATANTAASTGFEAVAGTAQGTSSVSAIITVKENSASGTNITTTAIMALVSYGPNKLGGYNAYSASANTSPNASSDEYENTVSSTNATLVNSSTSTTYAFDDLLLFKTKLQLATDAGWEFMMCAYNESNLSSGGGGNTLRWANTYYGTTTTTTDSCVTPPTTYKTRTCGRYGQWGAINSNCDS